MTTLTMTTSDLETCARNARPGVEGMRGVSAQGRLGVLFNITLADSDLQANDFPLDHLGNCVSN
jgi:hypothetical protein